MKFIDHNNDTPICVTNRSSIFLKLLSFPLAGLLLLAVSDGWGSALQLNGYGTLAYSVDDNSSLAPLRDINQRDMPSSRDGYWQLDSRLGVQLSYRIDSRFEAVGQLSLRPQHQITLKSSTELAYLRWQMTPRFQLRLGKVGYAAYLMSDHRNLGYGYSWLRPPPEYYGWAPIYSVLGVDASWSLYQGTTHWELRLQGGGEDMVVPWGDESWDIAYRDLQTLTLSRIDRHWTLKLGLSRYGVDNEPRIMQPVLAGLQEVARLGVAGVSGESQWLYDGLNYDAIKQRYGSLGVLYDSGRWFAQGELGVVDASARGGINANMGYVAAGHRFGLWLPYAIFGYARSEPIYEAQYDWAVVDPDLVSLQQVAVTTINALRIEQQTLSIGTRWDFQPQMALKLQWDHIRVETLGYLLWFRDALDLPTQRVNMFSVGLDFIF
ncbi:hypothetical protein D5085_03915 [Ectothiorhodospiraceae bacterium BW-2]|nr:hypothetical protein D5085_03915 [Ectothiorhodospiraceae bacterium BW-2]